MIRLITNQRSAAPAHDWIQNVHQAGAETDAGDKFVNAHFFSLLLFLVFHSSPARAGSLLSKAQATCQRGKRAGFAWHRIREGDAVLVNETHVGKRSTGVSRPVLTIETRSRVIPQLGSRSEIQGSSNWTPAFARVTLQGRNEFVA